jgi:hypothetical protein
MNGERWHLPELRRIKGLQPILDARPERSEQLLRSQLNLLLPDIFLWPVNRL